MIRSVPRRGPPVCAAGVRWIPRSDYACVMARLATDPRATARYPFEPMATLRNPVTHAAWMRAHEGEIAARAGTCCAEGVTPS